MTSVIITNIYRILPVLSTKQKQRKEALLRESIGKSYRGAKG